MKKRTLIFVLLAVILVSIPAGSANARSVRCVPSLSFEGTTAVCSIFVKANSASDKIELEMKLWEGTKCIKTWNGEGTSSMTFEKSKTVTKGKTYKLTVDVTINGTEIPTASASGTCK